MFRKGMYLAMVLAVTLAASGPALAAGVPQGRQAAARVEKDGGFFLRAWQWIQALWGEQGGCIDPDGKCASTPAAPTADNGACIDPNGKCASATAVVRILGSSDAGPCMDPNGKCTTAPH